MIDLKLIPTNAYLAAIAALTAALVTTAGVQQVRISNVRAELAGEKEARTGERNQRLAAALNHKTKIGELERAHAASTNLKEKEYANRLDQLEIAQRDGAAVAGKLRNQIASYAARDRRPGETDAVAVERYAGRLEVVGGLLQEGIDLVVEGRDRLGRRDLEVNLLLDQIQIDRTACTALPTAATPP